MAISAAYTEYKENILAKNSDRPTGECQRLIFFPARKSERGARLKMTDLEIDDTESTYALIGSQPYWTWGFEMGFNQCGLMIGNEAQGSKNAEFEKTGILGLDLVRLGLERGANAREAIEVITSLLEIYGQNANASQLTDRRYENSYLLVDGSEIWLLETAGREWVARRISDRIGISNCYSIEEVFELSSPKVESTARKSRWLAPDEPFNFAKAYTKPAIRQTLAVPRMRRLNKLLSETGIHNFKTLRTILRDHFDGEITEERFSPSSATFFSVCMHMMSWGESETTASLISHTDCVLGVVSRWAAAQPCQSVYLPIYFTGYIPKSLSVGDAYYSPESFWWRFKRLSLVASVDSRLEGELVASIREAEERIELVACEAEESARGLMICGKSDEALEILNSAMDKAVEIALSLCDRELVRLQSELDKRGGLYGPQAENIRIYCNKTGIKI